MKKSVLVLSGILFPLLMVGCSSGTSSSSSGGNQSSAPIGPISYQYVIDSYASVVQNQSQSTKKPNSVWNPTCGLADNGVAIATGAFSFIPAAAPVLGPIAAIVGILGGQAGSSCVTQQLNAINATLNYQESQIQSLQVGASYFDNQFAMDNYVEATQIATDANYAYAQSLEFFIGNNNGVNGLFANLMMDAYYWSDNGQPNTIVESQIGNAQVNAMNPNAVAQQEFQQNLANVAGVGVDLGGCTINCYTHVDKFPGSALNLTLNSLYQQLLAEIQKGTTNTNYLESTNVVAAIDGYNSTVNGIYMQALSALQEAYAIEYMTNLTNFEYMNNLYFIPGITPSIGNVNQANSYANVAATSFNYVNLFYQNGRQYPTQQQTIAAYNAAQEQLTLFFSAAVNQLYQTIVSYTLSDSLIGNQSFPGPATITQTLPNGKTKTYPYTVPYNLVNTAVVNENSYSLPVQTPLNLLGLESINIAGYYPGTTPAYMIYQSQLNNVAQCMSGLDQYNSNNSAASFAAYAQAVEAGLYQCSPVYGQYSMGNYIPGQTLSFWWADETSHAPIATLGASWNNLANTPTQFVGDIYNINNYSLNNIYANQPGVYYLVNSSYNQPESNAYNANNTWIPLGLAQNFTNTKLTPATNNLTNYIPFYPTVYNTATNSLTVSLMSSSTSYQDKYVSPGVLPNGYTINTTPSASNFPSNSFFNPLGYDAEYSTIPQTYGSGNSVIYYYLPDGTPLVLDIYLGSYGWVGNTVNVAAYAQLYYNPANYPTVNCNGSTAVCTTLNGNSYQLNFTASSTNGIALSATSTN